MQLIFFHYHLNRGGVTSVIRSHLQSLATVAKDLELERILLVYGGRATDWSSDFEHSLPFAVDQLVSPSLEYDELQSGEGNPSGELRQAFTDRGYEPESTVLHAHNHALGKNASFPKVIGELAADGWRVLLQVHDFVEDLRPSNYAHLMTKYESSECLWSTLYPQAPQIHYATLNRADFEMLTLAGIDKSQMHLLPNPVDCKSVDVDEDTRFQARQKLRSVFSIETGDPYVIYPVRGIRRKNLGEVLLWSSLLDDVAFSITLEPQNERERKSYVYWQELAESVLAKREATPIIFGSGEHMSLDENYAAADAVISTSVAEGFGLVFLEASLRGRPLFGRNLPGVTGDFVESGMQFPGLADEILVPVSAFDKGELTTTYQQLSKQINDEYQANDTQASDWKISHLIENGFVDFGRLSRKQQTQVVLLARSDADTRQQIMDMNPLVSRVCNAFAEGDLSSLNCSAANRAVIERHYSEKTIGSKLGSLYRKLMSADVGPVQSRSDIGRNLLAHFVRPQNIRPIRIEP